MRRLQLGLLIATCAACGGGDSSQSQSTPATANSAAAAVAAPKIGLAAARAAIEPITSIEVIADDAVLRRIIAKDATLTPADIERLYAGGTNTKSYEGFDAAAKVEGGLLYFRSADDAHWGVVDKFDGDHEGKHYLRYSVAVFDDPSEAEKKEAAEMASPGKGCYKLVGWYSSYGSTADDSLDNLHNQLENEPRGRGEFCF